MPTYVVTGPDGKRYRVTAPEGATEADVMARVSGQAKPTSFWQGVAEGIQKPATNAVRMLAKTNPIGMLADAATGVVRNTAAGMDRGAETAKARSPYQGSTLGRIAGGVVGTVPSAFIPGGPLVAPMAQGAAAGALASNDINDVQGTARDAAIGSAFGLGGGLIGKAVSKGVARAVGGRRATPPAPPKMPKQQAYRDATEVLSKNGVLMTPGMRRGGMARRIEDAADTIPLSPSRAAKEGSLVDFNRGVYNQVLEPLGIKAKSKVTPGQDAYNKLDDTVSTAYDQAAQGLRLQMDDGLMSRLSGYADNAVATMGPEDAAQLNANIANILKWRQRDAPLAGKEVSATLADMRKVASSARASGKMTLADTLWSMHDDIEHAAMSQSPQGVVSNFARARESMRRMHILDKAGAKSTDGFVTPSQFKTAVHSKGYGVTDKRLARGEAPMQNYADAAALVLPDRLPNSGTAERAGLLSLANGAAGAGAANLLGIAPIAAPLAAAPASMYIPAVNRLMQYGRQLSPSRIEFGGAVNRSAPMLNRVGTGLGSISALSLWPYDK